MNRQALLLFIIVPVLLLSSCASNYLSSAKMGGCKLGDAEKYYSDEGDVGDFNVNIYDEYTVTDIPDTKEIDLIFYETFLYQTNKLFGLIPVWAYPIKKITTYSVLAFENEELIFWGYPEDFLKSDNPKIRQIGSKISQIIFENYI